MRRFADFACTALLVVLLSSCAGAGGPPEQPATTAENFGFRELDPWRDDASVEEEQVQGRRVYVPEPASPPEESVEERTEERVGAEPDERPEEEGEDLPADPPADPPPADPPADPPAELEPTGIQGRFDFDDEVSLLFVRVFKDENTLGARFAHNHAIRSTGWRGSLERHGAGTECTVSLELPVDGLIPDEPAMRRRVGYDDEISANQREEIRGHMLAENQLDVGSHPTISFEASRCAGADGDRGRLLIDGELTIRGRAQSVRMDLEYRLLDGLLYLRGELAITHRDFGFAPYSAFGGSVRNQEGMILGFDFQSLPTN